MDGRVFLQRFRFPGRDVDSFVIPASEVQSRPEAEICLPDGEPNGIRIDGPQIKIGLLLALESGYDGYVIDEPYVQALAAPDVELRFVGYKNVADTLRKLNLDGLLLIGGNFDSPADYYLFPEKLPAGHRLSERSAAYLEAIAFAAGHKLPVLGICAGFQMLAGFFGAKMYTNVTAELGGGLAHKSDKYQDAHTVRLTPGTRLFELCGKKNEIMVNSVHTEGVAELAGSSELVVSARSADGNVEAVEARENWFALGVQWHPEYLRHRSPEAAALFAALSAAARKYRQEKIK